MNIIPKSDFKSKVSTDQDKYHTSNAVPSLPDTLRQQNGGTVSMASQLNDRHPLESRLKNWNETQHNRNLEQYRQIFGIAEPMKRVMELNIVESTDFKPLNVNGHSSIHNDILMNRDSSIDWEDIYPGTGLQISGNMVGDDIHTQIERKVGI